MQQVINDNWENIRLILPPTFSGRYDKESFSQFMEANLQGLGFIALSLAILFLLQVCVCAGVCVCVYVCPCTPTHS